MSEVIATDSSKAGMPAGRRWLDIATRILAAVILILAVVGFILNAAELVGVWAVRAPAINGVSYVAATTTQALETVDNGLARVNTRVQQAQQTLKQVNNQAAQLGDRVVANSPLVNRLSQFVDTNLAPRIEDIRTRSSAIRDAVVTVNSVLLVLNRLQGVKVPALSDALKSVSDRAQDAQAAVQDLRVTLAGMKAGLAAKAQAVVTQVTSRINAALARVQAIINTYRGKITNTQERITSTSNTILLLINVLAVTLTLLLIIFEIALVLLIFVCWRYVRTGRLPSMKW